MWLREEDGRVRLRPQPSEAPSSPATLLPFPWAGRPQTGTGDAVLAGQVPCPGAHPGCVALRGAAPGTSCARSTGWGPGPRPIAHQNSAGITSAPGPGDGHLLSAQRMRVPPGQPESLPASPLPTFLLSSLQPLSPGPSYPCSFLPELGRGGGLLRCPAGRSPLPGPGACHGAHTQPRAPPAGAPSPTSRLPGPCYFLSLSSSRASQDSVSGHWEASWAWLPSTHHAASCTQRHTRTDTQRAPPTPAAPRARGPCSAG